MYVFPNLRCWRRICRVQIQLNCQVFSLITCTVMVVCLTTYSSLPWQLTVGPKLETIGCLLTSIARRTIWKGGQGSCIFSSCIAKRSPQLKLQVPCPLLHLVTLVELLQLLSVVMKREFHQVLHVYKGHLLKFPFQCHCSRYRSPAVLLFRGSA